MDRSAAVRLPARLALVRRLQFALVARAFRQGRGRQVIAKSIPTFGEADQAAMQGTVRRAWFHEVFAEAVRQGGRACAEEAALYRRDWGFSPSEVPVETWLWYGELDTNVPADVGRWLHDEIPNSHLTVWPEHGHFTWAFGVQSVAMIASLAEAGHERIAAS